MFRTAPECRSRHGDGRELNARGRHYVGIPNLEREVDPNLRTASVGIIVRGVSTIVVRPVVAPMTVMAMPTPTPVMAVAMPMPAAPDINDLAFCGSG